MESRTDEWEKRKISERERVPFFYWKERGYDKEE